MTFSTEPLFTYKVTLLSNFKGDQGNWSAQLQGSLTKKEELHRAGELLRSTRLWTDTFKVP